VKKWIKNFKKIKSGTRQGSLLLLNIILEFIPRTVRQEEEMEVINIVKWVVKLSLFADDMILCLKTQILLDTKNSINKVAGYQINIQKSVVFVYTKNEQNKKEYRKIIPFTIVSKK
jgi:hypothetical protein